MRRRAMTVASTENRSGLAARYSVLPLTLRRFHPFALALFCLFLLAERQWYTTAPMGDPVIGANFSCKRAEYFGQDCDAALASILDDLGVRRLRLSVYWSDVEREPFVYDWSSIDRQLNELQARGAMALVSIGAKAQRYPEYWLPTWLRLEAKIPIDAMPEDDPLIQQHLFPFLEAATAHLATHPEVEALQVENEPFVHFEGHAFGWRFRKPFVQREIETVRAADGGRHPLVISHASWLQTDQTWRWILDRVDVVGQSVYTKRQRGPWPWLYIFPYRIGPLTPDLPGQARTASRQGRQLWITELQAEPYEGPGVDVRRAPPAEARSFSVRWLDDNLTLARRSGATRVYLWGIEWWLFRKEQRGDDAYWQRGRQLWAKGDTRAAEAGRTEPP